MQFNLRSNKCVRHTSQIMLPEGPVKSGNNINSIFCSLWEEVGWQKGICDVICSGRAHVTTTRNVSDKELTLNKKLQRFSLTLKYVIKVRGNLNQWVCSIIVTASSVLWIMTYMEMQYEGKSNSEKIFYMWQILISERNF